MRRWSRTRSRFGDKHRIRKRAEKRSLTTRTALERWWSQKYGQPTTSPAFTKLSPGELLERFYVDMFQRKAELEADMLEADADSRVHLQRALRAVDAILNDTDPND